MTASATAGTGEGRADPGLREQLTGFRLVGGVTTAAYLLLYVLLRPSLGEQVANLVALALTVDANTVANRRLSFAVRADGGRGREHAQAWVAFAVCLLLSSGALAGPRKRSPASCTSCCCARGGSPRIDARPRPSRAEGDWTTAACAHPNDAPPPARAPAPHAPYASPPRHLGRRRGDVL